ISEAMRQLEGGVYRSARRVLALSCFTRERLRRVVGVAPERIAVVPGGVSLPPLMDSEQRAVVRQQLGWRGAVVVTLRNLVPRTGVDLLVQSAAILRHSHPDLRWCVIGDGELGRPLRDLSALLHVDHLLEWCGYLDEEDVRQRMQAADLFMLPTRSLEGFGLVTVEAASHGLPVVATPVDANIEVVPSIDGNYLAAAATPQALVQATVELLADTPDDLTAYRHHIRQQVVDIYSWERHDAALLQMVAQLYG
ncbi:MAG: glycosyltransferase family 4 protein, partial [Mariprofundales bacterium]|nr:glycosyltransferase family 4 protein [Mariprofundales bacterium]